MELNCPSCKQRLSIPDQYAGQLMKCPMCNSTFTAPSLQTAPPPPAPPAPATPSPPPAPPPRQRESVSPQPPPPTPPAWEPVEEVPAEEVPEAPAQREPLPGDYRHRLSLWLSARILQWVPPIALFLVFVLTFFPWVSFNVLGARIHRQNAWQAAFASYWTDEDLKEMSPYHAKGSKNKPEEPGACVPLIFYVLLLPIVVILAIGSLLLAVLPINIPEGLRQLAGWRWALTGGLVLFLFLLLLLQMTIGFSMHNRLLDSYYKDEAEHLKQIEEARKRALEQQDLKDRERELKQVSSAERQVSLRREMVQLSLRRTSWLNLASFLHFLAVISAAIVFWNDLRGAKPMPRIDMLW